MKEMKEHDGFFKNDKDDYETEGGLCVPKTIFKRLYPHQKAGVLWLWGLHRKGLGGILADDMG
jgi:SNF2 family DNA or RNA helicase